VAFLRSDYAPVVPTSDPGPEPQTWHHGVVARWWSEFNVSGVEIPFFKKYVEAGQPALDVACGTGRLLIPYLRAGLEVDGCDISPDMLALCRERAEREGFSPNLYAQPMHRLDIPRTYRTIFVCGGFGLGGNRDHDVEALRRIHDHLEPGGVFILDNEAPYNDSRQWRYWPKEERAKLPEPWGERGKRRTGSDGTEYELRSRIVEVDPLSQRVTMEMRGFMWRQGRLVEQDEHVLQMTIYFTGELKLMLERAGFSDVGVRGGYAEEEPTGDSEFLVFIARKPRR
jgi:SAM-dependent methyltransferase